MHAAGGRRRHQSHGRASGSGVAAQIPVRDDDVGGYSGHGHRGHAIALDRSGGGQAIAEVGAGLLKGAIRRVGFSDRCFGASSQIHAFTNPGANGVILIRWNRDGG